MSTNCLYLSVLFCLTCLSPLLQAQEKVDWEEKLKECEASIPIRGSSKFDDADQKIAQKFEGIELVWLHLDKSIKKDSTLRPKRVFLISETLRNGSRVEYITPVEDRKAGINAPIFPDWKSKKNKFYVADCFEKIYRPASD